MKAEENVMMKSIVKIIKYCIVEMSINVIEARKEEENESSSKES